MIGIGDRDRQRVSKYRSGFAKRHAVRSEVRICLAVVPFEAECHRRSFISEECDVHRSAIARASRLARLNYAAPNERLLQEVPSPVVRPVLNASSAAAKSGNVSD